jgi:hypothetical protein
MPKTYTAAGSATAGEVYTSSAHNVIVTNVNNFIVPPIVKATRLTTQSINNSTDTFVTWTAQEIDTDDCFAPTSDTITIQTAGVYLCQAQLVFASNGTGNRFIHIVKNDDATPSFTLNIASAFQAGNATNNGILSCSCVASLAASDTLKVIVFQSSGGALNVGDTAIVSFFSATWIGRTT